MPLRARTLIPLRILLRVPFGVLFRLAVRVRLISSLQGSVEGSFMIRRLHQKPLRRPEAAQQKP